MAKEIPDRAADRSHRRRFFFPITIFLVFALSIAGFALSQLVASGVPKAGPRGWAEVVTANENISLRATFTATFDAGKQTVSYALNSCSDPTSTQPAPWKHPVDGALLLFGSARVRQPRLPDWVSAVPLGAEHVQRVVGYSFSPSTQPMSGDIQVFRFSLLNVRCTRSFATPNLPLATGSAVLLSGKLESPVLDRFELGSIHGPHGIFEWPSVGVPNLDGVKIPGLPGSSRSSANFLVGEGTYAPFVSTYQIDGGSLTPDQEIEELRPSSVDGVTLRFVGDRGLTPFVRFQDVASLQRWQAVSTFMTVVFGLVTAFIGAVAYELWRDARKGHVARNED